MNILNAIEDGGLTRRASGRVLRDAEEDVARGRITRPSLSDRTAVAFVADRRRGRVRVRLIAGDAGLHAQCECGRANGRACRHAAALELLLRGQAAPEREQAAADTLEEAERRRRVERGMSDLFTIDAVEGGPWFGRFRVRSPSEQAYQVAIRSLSEPHNGCTCPDFATNRLGTCKHVEAALVRLRGRRGAAQAAAAGAPGGYLWLDWRGGTDLPDVRLHLPPAAAGAARRLLAPHFDGEGKLSRELASCWDALGHACLEAGVELGPEVAAHARRLIDAEQRGRRAREVEAEARAAGATPVGFSGQLYGYQTEGVAFLLSRGRALLADDMGLGKTAQAIAAFGWLLSRGEVRRALIVCPASLKHQWAREIARFADVPGLRVVVAGGPRDHRLAQYAEPAQVLVTSYELVRADEREVRALAPDLLILDEAQRIKNWRIRTAGAVKRIPCRFAFVLTGTPLENRLDDLYSLMQVVDPHLLGPLWCFNREFAGLDDAGRPVGYRNLDVLRARLAPVMLRRRKEQVLHELPEVVINRSYLRMTTAQRDLHDEAEGRAGRLLNILKRRPLRPIEEQRLMAAFQRMRMSCDAAEIVDQEAPRGSPKIDELSALLDDLCVQQGEKVVVFSEWERMQRLAAAACDKLRVGCVRLHGGVPSARRGAIIDRFREDPACKAFLSTDAGGVGLNLQVARHVINLDLPWNPAVLGQRIARLHRIGQQGSVHAVFLIAEHSFEHKLEATLGAKRALFAAAVGDDTTTTELERTSLARRIATLLGDVYAAETGRPESTPDAAPVVVDKVERLRDTMGDALERVVRARDGRLVALVRGEAPAGDYDGALVLPLAAAEAMERFGEASPLCGAEVLHAAPASDGAGAEARARAARLAAAARKLCAAEALAKGVAPAEALGLARDAMAAACLAIAGDGAAGAVAGAADPAALLALVWGRLVPEGRIAGDHASALARASDAARAFAHSPIAPPAPLVAQALADARAWIEHAGGAGHGGADAAG